MDKSPAHKMLEDALKQFRDALVEREMYGADHRNLDRACNGATDFVDFLLNGPGVLRKYRLRKKA